MSNRRRRIGAETLIRNETNLTTGMMHPVEMYLVWKKIVTRLQVPIEKKTILKQTKKIVSQKKATQALMRMTGLSGQIGEKETITFDLRLLIVVIINHLIIRRKRLLSN